MPGILTVTLNPAIDIAANVDQIVPTAKLRCHDERYEPGGGGVNVARVVKALGGEAEAFVVTAGAMGQWLEDMLRAAGVIVHAYRGPGATRTSFHVRNETSGELYRFVLPGPALDAHAADAISAAISALLSTTTFDYLVFSGSLPPGTPDNLVPDIAALCQWHGTRMIADTSGRALMSLVGKGCYLVKPSRSELLAWQEALGWQDLSLGETARRLIARDTAEVLAITLGSEGALLVTADQEVMLPAPHVEDASAVGAGDSFVAGFVLSLAQGQPLDAAFRYAIAAGAAAVMTPGSELARKEDVARLFAAMTMQQGG